MLKSLLIALLILASFSARAEDDESPADHLSEQDQKILDDGRVSGGLHGAADMAGAFIGFGLGHAMQGRWKEKGWVFTAGELATLTMAVRELRYCGDETSGGSAPGASCGRATWWGGGFAALKIWEIIDLAYWAGSHDRRLEELEIQGYQPSKLKTMFVPVSGGALLGMSYRF